MNKKENPGVSRRWAAMLLLFSLAVSVLLGFAMPVHAADGGRTTLRTLRVGFYPYTGYMATAADGSPTGPVVARAHQAPRGSRQPQRLRL